MPVSAETLRVLIAAGLEGDRLIAVVEAFDREMATMVAIAKPHVDETAEKRREWDRRRKAEKRAQARPVDTSGGNPPDPASQGNVPPDPPKTQPSNHNPPSPPSGAQTPARKSEPRGSFIDPDWAPTEAGWAMAMRELGSKERAGRTLEKFRNHWLAKSGADGRKRDWNAAWRTWVMNEVDYDAKRQGSRGDGQGRLAFGGSKRTGFDAVAAGVARVARARGLDGPGWGADVEPDAGDPSVVDADWRPAEGD